jgi:hypothetical protein
MSNNNSNNNNNNNNNNREVLGDRPDIIIKNKTDNIFLLIDVTIPSDRNTVSKEAEKS